MKFLKVSSSFLTAVTLFAPVLAPAHAGMPDFSRLADPTAACKDVNIGNDTHGTKNSSDDTYKSHGIQDIKDTHDVKDTSDASHKDTEKTSGGINLGPIGGNASHEESHEGTLKTDRSRKDENSLKTDDLLEKTRKNTNEESTSTVRQGKDCDRVIDSVAKVDMNKQDNETARYVTDKKAEAEREKAHAEMMKNLLKW